MKKCLALLLCLLVVISATIPAVNTKALTVIGDLDGDGVLAVSDYIILKAGIKANGQDVTVYDFTWGGRNLDYIYTNKLKSASSSILDSVDYVFMSEAGENNSALATDVSNIMKLFTKPGVQFYYLCHAYTYRAGHSNIKNAFTSLQEKGVKIINWGQMVYNVWKGTEAVPGATQSYSKTTFINDKLDTHHQNMLSGYTIGESNPTGSPCRISAGT